MSPVEGTVQLGPEDQDGAAQPEDQQGTSREDADREMEAEREGAYSHGWGNATTAGT